MYLIACIQLAATLFLTGLIWTIQWVHYPSFRWVPDSDFIAFEKFHAQRISAVVLPLMLIELGAAFVFLNGSFPAWLKGFNLLSIVLIWLSTFFISVPCHQRLTQGKCDRQIQRLVATNWYRTGLWTSRSMILLGYFWMSLHGKI